MWIVIKYLGNAVYSVKSWTENRKIKDRKYVKSLKYLAGFPLKLCIHLVQHPIELGLNFLNYAINFNSIEMCVYFVNVNIVNTNSNQILSVCTFELLWIRLFNSFLAKINVCLLIIAYFEVISCNWIALNCNRNGSKLNSSKVQVEFACGEHFIIVKWYLLNIAVLMWHMRCDAKAICSRIFNIMNVDIEQQLPNGRQQ